MWKWEQGCSWAFNFPAVLAHLHDEQLWAGLSQLFINKHKYIHLWAHFIGFGNFEEVGHSWIRLQYYWIISSNKIGLTFWTASGAPVEVISHSFSTLIAVKHLEPATVIKYSCLALSSQDSFWLADLQYPLSQRLYSLCKQVAKHTQLINWNKIKWVEAESGIWINVSCFICCGVRNRRAVGWKGNPLSPRNPSMKLWDTAAGTCPEKGQTVVKCVHLEKDKLELYTHIL